MITMLSAGVKEFNLTKYLVSQLMLSNEERINDLRVFLPEAKDEDWEVITAGQRVQVIKDTDKSKGQLQFGTEVITSEDGSLAALLGAHLVLRLLLISCLMSCNVVTNQSLSHGNQKLKKWSHHLV